MKVCSKCKEEKDLSLFYKKQTGKFGRNSACILCESTQKKIKWAAKPKNPPRLKTKIFRTEAKSCTCCKEIKELDNFSKSKLTRDGYNFQCKLCIKAAKAICKSKKLDQYLQSGRDYAKKYKSENPELVKAMYASWAKKNRDYLNHRDSVRKAKKIRACPNWVDQKQIRNIYTKAIAKTKETSVEYQVDHIVPLVSNTVCGLHCVANLRIITKSENSSKGNHWWPDMWEG